MRRIIKTVRMLNTIDIMYVLTVISHNMRLLEYEGWSIDIGDIGGGGARRLF
tara:strand:+ start:560 stop:715 length:156 start_codon:yes stop_codon:yes gene_type:complete